MLCYEHGGFQGSLCLSAAAYSHLCQCSGSGSDVAFVVRKRQSRIESSARHRRMDTFVEATNGTNADAHMHCVSFRNARRAFPECGADMIMT